MWGVNVGDVGENVGDSSDVGFLAPLKQPFDPNGPPGMVRDDPKAVEVLPKQGGRKET